MPLKSTLMGSTAVAALDDVRALHKAMQTWLPPRYEFPPQMQGQVGGGPYVLFLPPDRQHPKPFVRWGQR